MKQRVKCGLRGKRLTVELSKPDWDVMFRRGLQTVLNQIASEKKMKKRFVVLPVDKAKKGLKTWAMSDGEAELCVQEGILESIRTMLRKYEGKL